MTILPKLLYFFRTLPINIPKSKLFSIQRNINKFIWAGKKPRCSYALMHRPQSEGGLGLPNIWLYYLAARLTQLSQWFTPTHETPWKKFEITSIKPLYLQGILWSNITSYSKLSKLNIIVAQFLQLWIKHKDTFKLSSNTPPLASFLGDPRFPLAYNNERPFLNWINKNLTTLRSLQLKWNFIPFPYYNLYMASLPQNSTITK